MAYIYDNIERINPANVEKAMGCLYALHSYLVNRERIRGIRRAAKSKLLKVK